MKKRFAEEQIEFALRQAEQGVTVVEATWKMEINFTAGVSAGAGNKRAAPYEANVKREPLSEEAGGGL